MHAWDILKCHNMFNIKTTEVVIATNLTHYKEVKYWCSVFNPISSASPLCVFQSGAYLTRASHLNPSHPPPTSQYPYGALCISQFQDRRRHDSSRSWSPPWLIQTLGRWSSNCFTLYIRTPPSILQKVAGMLATSRPSGLTPRWGMRLTRWLIRYLAGCVAATLIS